MEMFQARYWRIYKGRDLALVRQGPFTILAWRDDYLRRVGINFAVNKHNLTIMSTPRAHTKRQMVARSYVNTPIFLPGQKVQPMFRFAARQNMKRLSQRGEIIIWRPLRMVTHIHLDARPGSAALRRRCPVQRKP